MFICFFIASEAAALEAEAKAKLDKATREEEQKGLKRKREAEILHKESAPQKNAPSPPPNEAERRELMQKLQEDQKAKQKKEEEEEKQREQGIVLQASMKNFKATKLLEEMKEKDEKERKQKEKEAKKKADEEYKKRQEQEKKRQEQEKKRKEEEEKIRIEKEKYNRAETARKQKEEREKREKEEREKREKNIESEKEKRAKMLAHTAQTTEHREKKETEIRRSEPQKPEPTVKKKIIRNDVYRTDRPSDKFYVRPELKEEEKYRREDENWARKNIPEDYQKNQKLKENLADVKESPDYDKYLPDDPAFLPYREYRNKITFKDKQQFETEFNPQLSNIFGASDAAQRGESGLSDLDRARRELPEKGWAYGRDWRIRNNRVDYIGPAHKHKQFWHDYDYISITNRNAISEKEDEALQRHFQPFISYVRERVDQLGLIEGEKKRGGHFHYDEKSKTIIPHSQEVRDLLMPLANEYTEYKKSKGPPNLGNIDVVKHDPNSKTTKKIEDSHVKMNNLPTPQQPSMLSNMLNYVSSKLSRPDPQQPLALEDRQQAPRAQPQQTQQRQLDIPAYRPQPTTNESRMLQPPPAAFPSYRSQLPSHMPSQQRPTQSQLPSRQQPTFQSHLPQVSVRPRTKRTPQYSEAPLPSTSIRDVNIKKPTNNPLPEKPDFTFLESLQPEPVQHKMRLRERSSEETYFPPTFTPGRIFDTIVAKAKSQDNTLTHAQAEAMRKEINNEDNKNLQIALTQQQKKELNELLDKYVYPKKKR